MTIDYRSQDLWMCIVYAIALPLCYTPPLTLGDGRAKIGLPRPRPDVEDAPDPEPSGTIMKADGTFLQSSFDQKSVLEDIKSVPADFEVCHFSRFFLTFVRKVHEPKKIP